MNPNSDHTAERELGATVIIMKQKGELDWEWSKEERRGNIGDSGDDRPKGNCGHSISTRKLKTSERSTTQNNPKEIPNHKKRREGVTKHSNDQ